MEKHKKTQNSKKNSANSNKKYHKQKITKQKTKNVIKNNKKDKK